jgi:N-acetylneuraminic acid mutarotase
MKKFLSSLILFTALHAGAQGAWTQKANFPGTGRAGAVAFSIGTKAYFGTGIQDTSNNVNPVFQDWWQWDQSTNVWTQRANFPGPSRGYASGFAINNKGYVGTGYDGVTGVYSTFYEYDPSTNAWTQKANVGGLPRAVASYFAVGAKGYIASGRDLSTMFSDAWEYDPSTNTWAQKANFPGTARQVGACFSIGAKGYTVAGQDISNNAMQDTWEYDPGTNAWTQKANFGGGTRKECAGFSIGPKGYVGSGHNSNNSPNDLWEFDPTANTWTPKANFPGISTRSEAGFSVGSKGYFCSGVDQNIFNNELWEYDPNMTAVEETPDLFSVSIFQDPSGNISVNPGGSAYDEMTIRFFDLSGKQVVALKEESHARIINCSNWSKGIYLYEIGCGNSWRSGKIVLH